MICIDRQLCPFTKGHSSWQVTSLSFFFFGHASLLVESLFPNQGLNLGPRQ